MLVIRKLDGAVLLETDPPCSKQTSQFGSELNLMSVGTTFFLMPLLLGHKAIPFPTSSIRGSVWLLAARVLALALAALARVGGMLQ